MSGSNKIISKMHDQYKMSRKEILNSTFCSLFAIRVSRVRFILSNSATTIQHTATDIRRENRGKNTDIWQMKQNLKSNTAELGIA